MSHPFGELLNQYLHRKRGLSQSKLAAGILQEPAIISKMCKGERLTGRQARERVLEIIAWLHEMDALGDVQEANALLVAATMAPLRQTNLDEMRLLAQLNKASAQTTAIAFATKPPIFATPFIGRNDDIRIVSQHLADNRCRILTIAGLGGVGKTRLAVEAAELCRSQFAHGVCFVDLQPVTDIDAIPSAIASALGLAFPSGTLPIKQLESYLANKQLLLVLDNFEHLSAESLILTRLYSCGTGIKLLVTSREVLNLTEEWQYRLTGVDFPSSTSPALNDLATYDAVRLFMDCAQRVQPNLALEGNLMPIAQICNLTEGIPLAIQLAAAWTRTMTCTEIAHHLERDLAILNRHLRYGSTRHSSLEATFTHSWQMLNVSERSTFIRLTIFRGGFTREAAESVAGADHHLLTSLVDKSFLQFASSGRYHIHELMRQFAIERLPEEGVTLEETHSRHARYFADFLEQQIASQIPAHQLEAVSLCRPEMDNLKAAWHWAVKSHDLDTLYRSAAPLFWICAYQNRMQEPLDLLEAATNCVAQIPDHPLRDPVLIELLTWYSWNCPRVGRFKEAALMAQQSLELQASRDLQPRPTWANDVTANLSIIAAINGDYEKAKQLAQQAIDRANKTSQPLNIPIAKYAFANAALAQGEYDEAEQAILDGIRTCRLVKERWFLAYSFNTLGDIEFARKKFEAAATHFEYSFKLRQEFNDLEGMGLALSKWGQVLIAQGKANEAQVHLERSLDLYRDLSDLGGRATVYLRLGDAARLQKQINAAAKHYSEALSIAKQIQYMPLIFQILLSSVELFMLTSRMGHGGKLLITLIHHPNVDIGCKQQAQQLCKDYGIRLDKFITPPDWQSYLMDVCDRVLLDFTLPLY